MSSLAQTIDRALTNIGQGPRHLLLETLEAFETMGLGDEERICAIASAIAGTAISHHHRHVPKYLEAIRVWALELAAELAGPPPRLRNMPDPDAVCEGADLLLGAMEQLVEALRDAELQDRLIAELTVYTRLLGQHDPNTILRTLSSVADAVAIRGYRPGDLVQVPLRDGMPIGRAANLNELPPRGVA